MAVVSFPDCATRHKSDWGRDYRGRGYMDTNSGLGARGKCSMNASSFTLCGQQLSFVDTITHLGHLIHYNLSDVADINHKLRDMVKKANCLLASFPRVGPVVLTRLFQSYCLPLYGSALRSLSCPAQYHIEVAFNKVL